MKVTVHLPEDRVKLLRMLAEHEGGNPSRVVLRAVDQYVADVHVLPPEEYERRKQAALAVLGTWTRAQADRFRKRIRESRKSWR